MPVVSSVLIFTLITPLSTGILDPHETRGCAERTGVSLKVMPFFAAARQ